MHAAAGTVENIPSPSLSLVRSKCCRGTFCGFNLFGIFRVVFHIFSPQRYEEGRSGSKRKDLWWSCPIMTCQLSFTCQYQSPWFMFQRYRRCNEGFHTNMLRTAMLGLQLNWKRPLILTLTVRIFARLFKGTDCHPVETLVVGFLQAHTPSRIVEMIRHGTSHLC